MMIDDDDERYYKKYIRCHRRATESTAKKRHTRDERQGYERNGCTYLYNKILNSMYYGTSMVLC